MEISLKLTLDPKSLIVTYMKCIILNFPERQEINRKRFASTHVLSLVTIKVILNKSYIDHR